MNSPAPTPIAPWLQHLSQLMPPSGVLLIGAGNGVGPWVQLLQTLAVTSATLVEADDTQFEHLQRSVPQRAGWRLRKQVVGPRTETVTYHQASNAAESGLLEPESLRTLWPNLKTTHKQTRQAIALADLQGDADTPANWLLVDCLPALPILQGAAQQLAAFDVIALRVLLADETLPNSAASADEVQATLQAQGFRCLALETSRHPAVGHALFVRDTAAQAKQREAQLAKDLATLQTQHSSLAKEQSKLIADSAELTRARDQLSIQLAAEGKAKTEVQAQRDAEAKAKAEAIAQRDQLAKDKTALTAAVEEQTTHRQQQIEVLQYQLKQSAAQVEMAVNAATAAQAAAETLNGLQQQQVQHLTHERDKHASLEQQHAQQIDQLTQAKVALEELASNRQQQIEQISADLTQARARQSADHKPAAKTKDQLGGMDEFIVDISPFLSGRAITYVDVGACYGAVFLQLHQTDGLKIREAHLFEPNADNFEKLSNNIKDIKVPSLHAYKIGLSDTCTTKQFSKAHNMTKALETQIDTDSATNIFQVACEPLDNFASSFTDRRIDLLKIDVEGSELKVLEGAHQLLNDQKIDLIYIEVGFNINGTQQVYFAEVDAMLQKLNYRCFKIYEQVNEWMQDSPLLRRCNMAYMSTKFSEANPYKMTRELQKLRSQIKKIGNQA